MITLENGQLRVEISETGAEIRRVCDNGDNGIDLMWSGDEKVWGGVAPLLFPICGGLVDDKYTLEGVEYTLCKHGFARKERFCVEKQGRYSVTLLLCDNPETYAQYPYHFELRVSYTLRGRCVCVGYEVKNLNNRVMYCSIGSHEGYACPEGIEDYDIVFPQKETLSSYVLHGNLLSQDTLPIISNSDTLSLFDKYFEVDALVFKDLKSRSATLRNRKTGRSISVDFEGFDFFLLWHKHGAGYICLEPWCGAPSSIGDSADISDKEGIKAVCENECLKLSHTIYF